MSTENSLFLYNLYNNRNDGLKCAVLFTDVTKAFDTV